jgi:Nucleoside 2-deoxyribosyltransferase like
MKAGDVIEAIERFFLDIIGTVIPGVALILGFHFLLTTPLEIQGFSIFPPKQTFDWVVLITSGYIVGHAVTSIGHSVLLKGIESISARSRKSAKKWIASLVPKFIVAEDDLFKKIEADPVFKVVTNRVAKLLPELDQNKSAVKVNSWRNIAMSLASDDRHTVYRFMFLSLLNLGVATVLFLIAAIWLFATVLQTAQIVSGVRPLNPLLLVLLLVVCWPFLERRYLFYATAMQVPFSMAIAALQKESKKGGESDKPLPSDRTAESLQVVYLAGGFQSGWQEKVKLAAPQFKYLDPRSHGLGNNAEYTLWDLEAIRRCDWVFAYLEATNPGGFALALEVGYAKALGKRVIFVDEKSLSDQHTGRYLTMVGATSDVNFDKLDEGVEFLQKLQSLA